MTETEAIQVLAILKAAYPNSYKGMSPEEAKGTAVVWAIQFTDTPADVVLLAINKIISSSPFPPSISEVKKKIESFYWEAWEGLQQHKKRKTLSAEQEKMYEKIFAVSQALRRKAYSEPSLFELTTGNTQYLLSDK